MKDYLFVDKFDKVNCPKYGGDGTLSYHCDNCPYLRGFGCMDEEEFIDCSWIVI